MGEIKKVLRETGEVLGTVGEIAPNEIAGEPFICVYDQVKPRANGQEVIEKPLAGGLKAYVRFESSEKLNKIIGDGMCGTFVATKQNIEGLGMKESEVWEKATQNMKAIGLKLQGMIDMECEMMGITREQFEKEFYSIPEDKEMWIASTHARNGMYGAGVLGMPCMLDAIREKLGDYFIIPSSIHECICLPTAMLEVMDKEYIQGMVHEVNGTVVDPNEVLSNEVFKYDAQGLSVL